MSDVNSTNLNFNPLNRSSASKKSNMNDKTSSGNKNESADVINEISNSHAEIIGRSMLNTDTLKNNLDSLLENPQIAENADKLFEFAYYQASQSGCEFPYEEAALFAAEQL